MSKTIICYDYVLSLHSNKFLEICITLKLNLFNTSQHEKGIPKNENFEAVLEGGKSIRKTVTVVDESNENNENNDNEENNKAE